MYAEADQFYERYGSKLIALVKIIRNLNVTLVPTVMMRIPEKIKRIQII
jgi:hypothetical protein